MRPPITLYIQCILQYIIQSLFTSTPIYSRFDRTNSSSQSDGTDHPSYASNGMAAGKIRKIKPKSQHDYEDGLDSLQSEPSGWGELPSPRPSDLDNGTEFWGVPPDDLERQRRAEKASRISHSAMSSSTSDVGEYGVVCTFLKQPWLMDHSHNLISK